MKNWAVIFERQGCLISEYFFKKEDGLTIVSWKSAHGQHLTCLPKRGVGTLSTVSTFDHERAPMSCLQRLEALKANNWTQNNVQQNYQHLQSWVLMAHNTLNSTMWRWAWCSSWCSPHHLCLSVQRCLVLISVKYYMKFLMHSAGGCASKTPREALSRVGAHSGKLWPYTRNWAKSRGWALFREWALYRETTVLKRGGVHVLLEDMLPFGGSCAIFTGPLNCISHSIQQ